MFVRRDPVTAPGRGEQYSLCACRPSSRTVDGVDSDVVQAGYDRGGDAYLRARNRVPDPRVVALAGALRPGARVLDLGCGAGVPTARFLAAEGFDVIGLDVSPRQVERARGLVPAAAFAVRDMAALEPHELAVEAVVALFAIFHVPREAHAGIFRVLRSFLPAGGHLLVIGGGDAYEGVQHDFHGVPMFWSQHSAADTRRLVEEAGFRVRSDSREEIDGEVHQVLVARAASVRF